MLEMAAQLGKFTENHLIVHLRMGGFYSIYFTHKALKKKISAAAGARQTCKITKGSAQFSRSVVSDFLRPHGLQHARPPCHHQLPESTQTHVH